MRIRPVPAARHYAQSRYDRFRQQQQQQQYGDGSEQEQPGYGSGGTRRVLLLRPTLWVLAFVAGTYCVCASSFVDHQAKVQRRSWGIFDMVWSGSGTDDEADRVWALMSDADVQRLVGRSHSVTGESHARMLRRIARLPEWVSLEAKRTAAAFADMWYRQSRGARCVYTIAGLNAVVFGMWHVPRLLPLMMRSFLHHPRSGLSYTLLTSTFSHRELMHFAFNTLALVSFGAPVADAMGVEHFTAFYLAAGVVSGLASHHFAPLRAALILPTLGASGAVYGVVGAMMMLSPNSQMAIVFLPFLPFTISQGFPALMAYDLVGAVLGWRTMNHIAHLGGGLFGIAYLQWGTSLWSHAVGAVAGLRSRGPPAAHAALG
ncbi:hypothetical protein LPJ61_001505 [Coemansia biformis]|uniref:Peptidase S54 rhomboid domain-containing protein n=1 Tax=Coemansia biformis TaxID=1286918 RepID=A0A9W8D0K0_9FUNG|nr:hypothetical protein LPJ61_001505 [Coemansia biformis]